MRQSASFSYVDIVEWKLDRCVILDPAVLESESHMHVNTLCITWLLCMVIDQDMFRYQFMAIILIYMHMIHKFISQSFTDV